MYEGMTCRVGHGGNLSDKFKLSRSPARLFIISSTILASCGLDNEGKCRQKKEWHTVDPVEPAGSFRLCR